MSTIAACPASLKRLVADVAPARRGDAALRLAARFDAPVGSAEADLYDAALCELVREEPVPVRARVSERIAHVPAGPGRCALLFAHDPSVEVAGPVLRHSPLVPDPVLVALAWTRGQGHLGAIASRRGLAPQVADMVLARGAAPVLRTIAANDTARLSEDGFERLARLSRADGEIRAALVRRADLPREVRADLGLAAPAGEGEDPLGDGSVETAALWLAHLRALREPREVDVARALREGDLARAVAIVGHLARDELADTVEAFRRPAPDAMLLLLRLAGIGWPLAERTMRLRLGPGTALGSQQAAFIGLSRHAAERALKALRFRARVQVLEGAAD